MEVNLAHAIAEATITNGVEVGRAEAVDAIVKATLAKGVGVGRTEAHVEDALRTACNEVLTDQAAQARVADAIRAACNAVFTDLKAQTRGLVPAMMKIPPKPKK